MELILFCVCLFSLLFIHIMYLYYSDLFCSLSITIRDVFFWIVEEAPTGQTTMKNSGFCVPLEAGCPGACKTSCKSYSYCGWSNSRCLIYQAGSLQTPASWLFDTSPQYPAGKRNFYYIKAFLKGSWRYLLELHLFSAAWLVVGRVHNLNWWCGFLKHPL